MTPTPCIGKPHTEDPPTAEPGALLCRHCTRRLERHLAELPARRDQLRACLAGGSGGGGGRRGTPELPVPLNLKAHVQIDHLEAVVASWAQMVREERDLHGPDSDSLGPVSGWLLHQLPWLVEQPWVDDMAEEIAKVSHDADWISGWAWKRTRLEPACPRCGARDLGRWDGADSVDCASCGSTWDERQYPAFVRLALDASRGAVTAAEAAEALGVSGVTFRQWVSRGKVRKLGTVDGQARYSAADVEQVRAGMEQAS